MKRTLVLCIAVICAAVLLTAGCTGMQEHTITQKDNGATIQASTGDTFRVLLDENPTTGYTWQMDAGGLTPAGDEYRPDEASEGMVGAGGVHEFDYLADAPGTYILKGVYSRSWEDLTGDEQTFEVTIIVT